MKNIDQDEVAKFNRNENDWWDLQGDFSPLHAINPLRVGFINQRSLLKNKRVLDVGCGGGILSEAMSKYGANVVGIDAADKAIRAAVAHAEISSMSIDYYALTIEEYLKKEKGKFDIITCLEILEHIPNYENVLVCAKKLLKPGGLIYISTINRNMLAFMMAIVGAEYLLRLIPRGSHQYSMLIKPHEIIDKMTTLDFKLVNKTGLTYNPITKKYSLIKNMLVNYMLCFKYERHE